MVAVVISALLSPDAGASDLTVEEISQAQAEELKATWAEGRDSLREKSRLDHHLLIVPFFVVNKSSPAGVTTLFAVHADMDFTTPVQVRYEDASGVLFKTENYSLAPSSVLTVNIRDKNPPALVQGLAFGRVVIETNPGFRINGDYFQVDPAGNFGHGDGLISSDDMCFIEDVRYATGGIFDDTIIMFHFLQRTTPAMGGLAAAIVEVYSESGALAKTFQLNLPNVPSRTDLISAEVVLDQVGGGPPFGAFRFHWNPNTVGAAVTKFSTSAQSRFSVGLQGACRLGVLEEL